MTDEPVTFYNKRCFPSEKKYPEDVPLEQIGTRTIFPLDMNTCLIITHTQLCRNPWANPSLTRTNARSYQSTSKYLLDIQFGRYLIEEEVCRINLILKKQATRYVAAAEAEWLYPEQRVSTREWAKLDYDWFLLPHLYKIPFSRGIIVGFQDGSTVAMDEYGRHPNDANYQSEKQRQKEWVTHLEARKAWGKMRRGKPVAHVDKFRHDDVYDKTMREDLASEGP